MYVEGISDMHVEAEVLRLEQHESSRMKKLFIEKLYRLELQYSRIPSI